MFYLLLLVLCLMPLQAMGQSDAERLIATPVASLPTEPEIGTARIVTDGQTEADCTLGGGTRKVLCVFNVTWGPATSAVASSDTLQTVFARGKNIIGADSRENAMCVGDGVSGICFYTDATDGDMIRPLVDGNARSYIWPGFNWSLYDKENTKPMMIAAPNAISQGVGTVTMQPGEQFVFGDRGAEFTEGTTPPPCAAGNFNLYADSTTNAFWKCENGVQTRMDGEVIIRKTADEFLNANVTLQNDDHLVFAALANGIYSIRAFIVYDSSTTADFQYGWTLPAGATGLKAGTNAPTNTTACSGTTVTGVYNSITQTNNSVGGAGTGTANSCAFVIDATVFISSTPGNVQFRWAQAVSDATDTYVRTGSWMQVRKLN